MYLEGSRPTGVYCINEGLVKIYRAGSDGRVQIMKLAGPGDLAGHEAVLTEGNYKSFAEVVETSMVCYIPKNHFLKMLTENHSLTTALMAQISQELIDSEKRVTSLATMQVRERIAESLLALQEFYSSKNKGKQAPVISLSREELAAFAGTAPETAVRILSDFRQGKLISVGKRSISIVNRSGLLEIANRYQS